MKLYYHAKVEDGEIRITKRFKKEVVDAFNDKSIKITVERNRVKRSQPQNAYYWSVVLPYVRDGFIDVGNVLQRNGESIMLVHELMKEKFIGNGKEIADKHGQVHKLKSTTTALTKDEFSEYIDNIKQWSAEYLNISIPDPGQDEFMKL